MCSLSHLMTPTLGPPDKGMALRICWVLVWMKWHWEYLNAWLKTIMPYYIYWVTCVPGICVLVCVCVYLGGDFSIIVYLNILKLNYRYFLFRYWSYLSFIGKQTLVLILSLKNCIDVTRNLCPCKTIKH